MRLDRFLANATGLTRSQVHAYIKSGDVLVDGQQGHGAMQVNGRRIQFKGVPVSAPEPVYLMLHKPVGYVCANRDAEHPIVLDLLAGERFHPTEPLQIAGRLDLDTSGLVLLTTDGQWNHKITAPTSHCRKTYRVSLQNALTAADIDRLEKGIQLRSEIKPTLPCRVFPLSSAQVDIELREGKYHQVKRMFAALGNHVVALHRLRIGKVELDPTLAPGQFRHLTRAEVEGVHL